MLTIKAGNYTLATYEYAGNNGKLKKLTYGNGDYEEYIYDSLERLVSTKLNGVTEYTVKYDNNGRLSSLTEDGATHIYEYDSLDRLIRAWQEDSSGKTIISVENHYDSLGRSSGSTYGDVSSTSQQYNITYKANSNLIETYTMPGNKVNTYTYDEFERLSRKTHSSNVYTTKYAYLTTTEGNTSSLVSRMDIDSNAIDTYFTYTYDNLGNIVSIRQNGTVIESYEYDSLGQLTRANNLADNSSTFYEYDKSGNILHKFRFAYTTEPTADMPLAAADEITAYQYTHSGWGDLLSRYGYNGALIHYDEIGNPLNWRNATSLVWKARQLQSVALSETKSLDFEYNSSGIRTKKTYVDLNGDTWEYSYILDGSKIIKEAVHAFTTNSPAAGMYFDLLYYYDDSGIAAVYYNGTKYYYVKNLQGDVIGLVNASGQYVVQYVYDAWGRVVSTTGSMASTLGQYNPFRYRGYYYDRETGWYYLQSRYYDPTVGRFLNADEHNVITLTPSELSDKNLYAYCDNNPIVRIDDGGYFWATIIRAAVGVATQYVSDVVTNIKAGKTGIDIFAPTSSLGTYIAAGVSSMIPGNGICSTIISNVVNEGIQVVEKVIRGDDIDLIDSVNNVIKGSVSDYLMDGFMGKVDDCISSLNPKNYSTYANKMRRKNPEMTRQQITNRMQKVSKANYATREIVGELVPSAVSIYKNWREFETE